MRKKIVAGNWKMNTTYLEGIALYREIENHLVDIDDSVELIIAPPFTHISAIAKLARDSQISIAAQNCAADMGGAYTGEISVGMIVSAGASHVIIGHSERRKIYGESNAVIKKKIDLALESQLTPIFCCGESLEDRKDGNHFNVVSNQIEQSLFHLGKNELGKVIVAYEPVWAIGTGETATPEEAQEMHGYIRNWIVEKYGDEQATELCLLYGGSCNPANAESLFLQPDVDGGLIGGASLNYSDFIDIAKAFSK
ncbi:MAG TPA: triose-phosphate isomerase [Flavobacteriales bacterium]|nr:triose-phosphate isomerase [Flavobacteriales bacterium]HIA12939.1 triose-phosphate isomerase [Flavobacteriales bacterium]HIO71754.1 triose-phosphate isomerase [Flavobacteriales bacterium]